MTETMEGRVSVVIPARNEEATLATAVRSVASQHGVREILVVDDQSQDRTSEILQELKAEIPTLRTIRIEALPEGWVGKSHALATGARLAGGDWLLFTDADTEHLPGSLAAMLERAEREHASLLSVSPGQKAVTWWEKSVAPLVYTRLAQLYPFEEVSDPQSSTAAANGQYLMIRREVYDRVGGHEAVREKILEDVELARRVKAAGERLMFLPGAEWVETRMYRSFAEMWRGWTKNLYLLYERRLNRVLGAVTALWCLDLAPPLAFLAFCAVFALGGGSASSVLAAIALFLIAVIRQWSYARDLGRLGFEPRLASYQVPGAALLGLLLLNSARVHRSGQRIEWKGRGYPSEGKR